MLQKLAKPAQVFFQHGREDPQCSILESLWKPYVEFKFVSSSRPIPREALAVSSSQVIECALADFGHIVLLALLPSSQLFAHFVVISCPRLIDEAI